MFHQQVNAAAIAHIQSEIFEDNDALILFMKYNGIKKPGQLQQFSPSIIKEGKYNDDKGNPKTLNNGEIGEFRALQGYIRYRQAIDDPIELHQWTAITYEMYEEFCIDRCIVIRISRTTLRPAWRKS